MKIYPITAQYICFFHIVERGKFPYIITSINSQLTIVIFRRITNVILKYDTSQKPVGL